MSMFFALSAGVAAISLLLLSRGYSSCAFWQSLGYRCGGQFLSLGVSLYSNIRVSHTMALIGRGGEIKKKKRENLALLFTQVVLVKLYPYLHLQVAFLFGEKGVLDLKVIVDVVEVVPVV